MAERAHTPTATQPASASDPARSRLETEHVLVTGAAGWLGGVIAELLATAGHPVRVTDRVAIRPAARRAVHTGDLRDSAFCRELVAGVTTVVHCAARQYHQHLPRRQRERVFAENVAMSQALATAVSESDAQHVVFISSDMVYGADRPNPTRESDPLRPAGPYGRSKVRCEQCWQQLAGPQRTVTILRPRVIVGPGRQGVLRNLFESVRAGRRVPIIGRGDNRYQLVSVADVARAAVLAIAGRVAGCFNLGSREPLTVRALLSLLIAAAGSRSRLLPLPAGPSRAALALLDRFGRAPLTPEQYCTTAADQVVDITRARDILGWEPLEHDDAMLVAAYRAYLADRAT